MSSAFQLNVNKDGVANLVFDLPNEKVNKISVDVLNELDAVLDEAEKNNSIIALVIRSNKKDVFIAGADLKGFEPAFDDPTVAEKLINRGHEVFNRLSELPFPTIAVIDGACLGGGTELALACNYRVVTDNPKTQIGLPEVTLGIYPGWGGTQRLPRLVGIEQALNMILTGKSIDGKKAVKIKFADAIFSSEFLEKGLKQFLAKCTDVKGAKDILNQRQHGGFYHGLMERNPVGRKAIFHLARKNVLAKTKGQYPAPLVALDVIEKTYSLPLKEGLQYEIRRFLEAVNNEFRYAINLITLFFANEELKKNPGTDIVAEPVPVKYGGVIGAGTMGAGIAWLFSYRDIPVRFKDINWEAVGKGYASAFSIYKKLVKIRKLKPYQVDRKFQLLGGTTNYSGFEKADIVIEAATENLELKHKIFDELEKVVRPDSIIASNTSSLPIAEMSKHMKHPERFLGMHFFNPPNRMPLVEVVAGEHTSPKAIATAVELCRKFKKVPLIVKDCPGFLVNRIFAMAANEAQWMLQEGVEMERLDRVITGFGMPMGPFVLADEVGNDVAYKVFGGFHKAYGERMLPPEIGKLMFEAGLLGKKTGKGFYVYKGKKREENPQVKSFLKKIGTAKVSMSDEEIIDRFTLGMVNEAARCLEEGVVSKPLYVDMGLIYGIGFPPFRAGLLHYADSLGIDKVVDKLKRLSEKYGQRFAPCDYLVNLAARKGKFYLDEKNKAQEGQSERKEREATLVK